ncbi:unnamed protein product [Polarella glacialis]|uniref:Ribosomal RNA methyltransferase FtsJ domain-containing protein n=1 Tax=Polarella glacialis TaxID=89957 RepID=A0A813DG65_POLGL|nr:unnamed protein product [Polarella glacialis]CAE8672548.1 unnamed protein product [Polarella glacialis]
MRLAVRLLPVVFAAVTVWLVGNQIVQGLQPTPSTVPLALAPWGGPRPRCVVSCGKGARPMRSVTVAAAGSPSDEQFRREGAGEAVGPKPDLILSCPPSHIQRLTEYMASLYPCEILCSRTSGKGSSMVHLLLLRCHGEPALMMQKIASDSHLAWVVQKVYCIDRDEAPQPNIQGVAQSLAKQLRAISLQPRSVEAPVVRLACFPRSQLLELAQLLESNLCEEGSAPCKLSPTGCNTVATAFLVGDLWYTGVSAAFGQNHHMANKRPAGNALSRAYFKLSEALQRAGAYVKVGDLALDAGAAPGGWTQYLSEQGCACVYAVDPAELELIPQRTEDGQPSGSVEHLCATLAEASVQLAERQREGRLPPLDVLTSDMYLGMGRSCSVVRALEEDGALSLLRPGALVVVTLKGTEVRGHSKLRFDAQLAPVVEEFKAICEGVQLFHLMANRERERTLVGFKRGG